MVSEPPVPAPRSPASAETVAEARRLYETTELTQVEIAARVGMLPASLCRMAKRKVWLRPAPSAERRATVSRLRSKVDKEIAAVERVLGDGGDDSAGRARTLASLVRTLRELARYDEERAAAHANASREPRDDAVADIDEFRRDLARRLDRLREQHEA